MNKIDPRYATLPLVYTHESNSVLTDKLVFEPRLSNHKGIIVGVQVNLPKAKKFHFKEIHDYAHLESDLKNFNFDSITNFDSFIETIQEITKKHRKRFKFIRKKPILHTSTMKS